MSQWARKLKKVHAKKIVKSTNFMKKFFLPNSIFCYLKNSQKLIFELGKKAISRKNDLMSFF